MASLAAQRYNGTAQVRYELDEDTGQGTTFILHCPPQCAASADHSMVVGGKRGEYGEESNICVAAVHAGAVSDALGGYVIVTMRKGYGAVAGRLSPLGAGAPLLGSTANGVTTSSAPLATRTFSVEAYGLPFLTVEVQTIAGAPAAPLERGPCGFQDGEPPLSSRFDGPASVAVFFNASLSTDEMLYVADSHNHVVRMVTAVCSMTCENGGVCAGPERCICTAGWGGPDCTKPMCADGLCGPRQICTGPDMCTCIPGYEGAGCLTAQCVQSCSHGGVCIAPDTCGCLVRLTDEVSATRRAL